MILDAILVLFAELLTAFVAVAVVPVIAVMNLGAFLVELVVGFFVSGFEMKRLSYPKRRPRDGEGKPRALTPAERKWRAVAGFVVLLAIAGFALAIYLGGEREVTLVAEDGHSLPYAAVVVTTSKGDKHQRSDSAGHIAVPRLGLLYVTIKDPRYVEQTWQSKEVDQTLVVTRSLLGGALDKAAGFLLNKASKDEEK